MEQNFSKKEKIGTIFRKGRCSLKMLGKSKSKLDQKNRVSLPVKFRGFFKSNLPDGAETVCMVISDGKKCLQCYTEEGFEKKSLSVEQSVDTRVLSVDSVMDSFYDLSDSAYLDSQGRMTISLYLLEEAGISGDIVFVGKNSYFEIWNPEIYDEYISRSDSQNKKAKQLEQSEREAELASRQKDADNIINA